MYLLTSIVFTPQSPESVTNIIVPFLIEFFFLMLYLSDGSMALCSALANCRCKLFLLINQHLCKAHVKMAYMLHKGREMCPW